MIISCVVIGPVVGRLAVLAKGLVGVGVGGGRLVLLIGLEETLEGKLAGTSGPPKFSF